jgi:hypothetical protein
LVGPVKVLRHRAGTRLVGPVKVLRHRAGTRLVEEKHD